MERITLLLGALDRRAKQGEIRDRRKAAGEGLLTCERRIGARCMTYDDVTDLYILLYRARRAYADDVLNSVERV